jgi:hypothetical protein
LILGATDGTYMLGKNNDDGGRPFTHDGCRHVTAGHHMKRNARRQGPESRSTTTREIDTPASAGRSRSRSDPVRAIQRTAGNQAVQATVQRKQENGAGSGDERLQTRVSGAMATEAAGRALGQVGFEPASGHTWDDYVYTEVTGVPERNEQGTRHVRVRVGPDGHLLPNPVYQERQREAGEVDEGSLQGASHLLNIKVFRHGLGRHSAAVQFIDVESGVIENQRMGKGGLFRAGLATAIGRGIEKLEVPLRDPADGRVRERRPAR